MVVGRGNCGAARLKGGNMSDAHEIERKLTKFLNERPDNAYCKEHLAALTDCKVFEVHTYLTGKQKLTRQGICIECKKGPKEVISFRPSGG